MKELTSALSGFVKKEETITVQTKVSWKGLERSHIKICFLQVFLNNFETRLEGYLQG